MERAQTKLSKPIPFDTARLDRLLEDAGIDVLIATSKHNIQYLLGGYRFFFFDHFDAIGLSRYLPALIYTKGDPGNAVYIGHAMEKYERELKKFWVESFEPVSGSVGAMMAAARHLKKRGA